MELLEIISGILFGLSAAFSRTVANDLASRMILAGAPKENVTVFDTNDVPTVFSILDQIDTEVVYVLTNTVHAPEIKAHICQGGA